MRLALRLLAAHFQPCKGSQALAAAGNAVLLRSDVHGARYQVVFWCLFVERQESQALAESVVLVEACSASLCEMTGGHCPASSIWKNFERKKWLQSVQC